MIVKRSKKSKGKQLFLTQGTPKTDNFELFLKNVTKILRKIISVCVDKMKMVKKVSNF